MVSTLSTNLRSITWYFVLSLSLILVGSFHFLRKDVLAEAQSVLVPLPKNIPYLSFGFQENIADYLWIKSVLNFDYCENSYQLNEFVRGCRTGWLYHTLDLITDLSPRFRIPYAAGGLALSVVISDIEGASKFFDKSVKAFPNDWAILYRAAYHALYEEHDKLKAAKLMEQAAKNKQDPQWFNNLAVKLYAESGQKEMGLRLYQELKDSGYPEEYLSRMRQRLQIAE